MNARSIWQGTLVVQKRELAVKLYAAVEDRQVHFHLLHRRDHIRVQQRMVEAETGKPVPLTEARKAFEVEPGLFVAVTAAEIEQGAPAPRRAIRIGRFVPPGAIDPQLYKRPYYLGPATDPATDYFALAQALERKERVGIASWVMRKHSYVGALTARQGYLMLITLRHAEQVIPVGQLEAPRGSDLEPKERDLAGKLIEALSDEFQAEDYRDEYRQRVRELIEAKRAGKKVKPRRAPPRRREGSLADSLMASLQGVRKRRPA